MLPYEKQPRMGRSELASATYWMVGGSARYSLIGTAGRFVRARRVDMMLLLRDTQDADVSGRGSSDDIEGHARRRLTDLNDCARGREGAGRVGIGGGGGRGSETSTVATG